MNPSNQQQDSRYHGLRDHNMSNDIEAHPVTSQKDEFHFVEASQTIGCNFCCFSTESKDEKPTGGYDLFLRFLSEEFRSPEVLHDFYVFRSGGFNLPVMVISVNLQSSPNITLTD